MEKSCPGQKGQSVAYPRYPRSINPLSTKSDQHQISPVISILLKQCGHENYGHDDTR